MAGPGGTVAGAVGAFGKVPMAGDFISVGLPAALTEPLHAWLVAGLSAARDRLGERFEPAFLTAPAWRFLFPAGLAGPLAAAGVLLPSVDGAGRLFPLLLARCWDGPGAWASLADPGWFDALEDQGRLALEADVTLDGWKDGVAALPDPLPPVVAGWQRWEEAASAMPLALAATASAPPACLWGLGSPLVRPGWIAGPGLPAGEDFVRLLADAEEMPDALVPPVGLPEPGGGA